MAIPFANANGDKDVMASIAARLMGKSKTTPAPTPPPQAAPRSIPAPQVQPSSTASSTTSSVRHVPTSNVGSENVPPKQTLASTFVKASDDVDMTDINRGPSLFGSADQLAEARQFASSATAGGHKSRPASRRRLASKEPERVPSTSSSSSARTRLTTTPASSGWHAFTVTPTTTQPSPVRAEARPTFTLPAASQGRPAVTLPPTVAPTPAPTPVTSPSSRAAPLLTQRATGSNIISSPTKAENKGVNTVMKETSSQQLSHAHPTSPTSARKDQTKSLQVKQLADITNTFKERAANATAPPHLRSRAAAAGIPERKDSSPIAVPSTEKTEEAKFDWKKLYDLSFGTPKGTTTAVEAVSDKTAINKLDQEKTEAKANGLHGDQMSNKTVKVEPISQNKLSVQSAKAETALRSTPTPEIKTEPGSPKKIARTDSMLDVSGSPGKDDMPEKLANGTKTGDNQEIFRMLEGVHKAVTAINTRIERLEADNFEMQKQLVALVEERERRQFLGTDIAKMPFVVEVKASNGKTYKIQVNAELKVYELIRRVRAKAELAPMESTNPRVMVDGKVVGHGMMLGELGISNEKTRKVEFHHD